MTGLNLGPSGLLRLLGVCGFWDERQSGYQKQLRQTIDPQGPALGRGTCSSSCEPAKPRRLVDNVSQNGIPGIRMIRG